MVVTADSIIQCVREIRRALGDDNQRFLRTLPRRGSLFAVKVEHGDATATLVVVPSIAESETGPRIRAGTVAGRPVVSLLPFEGIGGEAACVFADGLAANLATDLTRFRSIETVGLADTDRVADSEPRSDARGHI